MITTVTCEQCGKKFTGYFTRRFCDDCRRLRNIAYMRTWHAAHPDYQKQLRARKKKEAQANDKTVQGI